MQGSQTLEFFRDVEVSKNRGYRSAAFPLVRIVALRRISGAAFLHFDFGLFGRYLGREWRRSGSLGASSLILCHGEKMNVCQPDSVLGMERNAYSLKFRSSAPFCHALEEPQGRALNGFRRVSA